MKITLLSAGNQLWGKAAIHCIGFRQLSLHTATRPSHRPRVLPAKHLCPISGFNNYRQPTTSRFKAGIKFNNNNKNQMSPKPFFSIESSNWLPTLIHPVLPRGCVIVSSNENSRTCPTSSNSYFQEITVVPTTELSPDKHTDILLETVISNSRPHVASVLPWQWGL